MPRLPGPILRTERLVLRVPKPRDVDAYYRYVRDPAVIKFLAWTGPESRADVANIAQRAAQRQRAGTALQYVLHHIETREPIGTCTVRGIDPYNPYAGDLGAWLAKPYWGQGLMPEAVTAVCRHAFTRLGLRRLTAGVITQNRRSANALRKLGFRHEATARHHLVKAGKYYDVDIFALLVGEAGARRLLRDG